MANIKPFKGIRYDESKAGALSTLVCPPYDIISDEERKNLITSNKYNMVRLELPEGEDRYSNAGALLSDWLEKGVLRQEEEDAIYIYEEEFSDGNIRKKIKGIIARVQLEEFSKKIILPHEETLSKAKADRFNLMTATGCNFSQIYSLYTDSDGAIFNKIEALSSGEADITVKGTEGIIHRMWIIKDTDAHNFFNDSFKALQLFIADGHHRYETALNYKNSLSENGIGLDPEHGANYVMMMLVNMENPGLVVYPTHRLVRDLPEFNLSKIIEKISVNFDVEKMIGTDNIEKLLSSNLDNKAFCMYVGGNEFYLIKLKEAEILKAFMPDKCDEYRQLDVSVLHSCILEPVFGIDKDNMAKQINLTYTKKTEDAISAVDSGQAQCSFIMNPTKVSQIKDVSLKNEKMPQKSTYFYPKIITGMVFNKLK